MSNPRELVNRARNAADDGGLGIQSRKRVSLDARGVIRADGQSTGRLARTVIGAREPEASDGLVTPRASLSAEMRVA